MIQNLQDSPAARRRAENGFTLIELLVVVIIIGILAAIAIPTFLSQRNKAKDADAKSAARNIATAVAVISTDCGGKYATNPPTCSTPISLSDVATADTGLTKYNVAGNSVNASALTSFTVTVVSGSGKTCVYTSTSSTIAC